MCIQNSIAQVAVSCFRCSAYVQSVNYQHKPVQSVQFAISRVGLWQMVRTHMVLAKVYA